MTPRRLPVAASLVAASLVVVAGGGGYWLGRSGSDRPTIGGTDPAGTPVSHPVSGPAGGGTIAYYQDPTGKPDYSPTPRKDAEGRDFVAVYADDGAQSVAAPASPAPAGSAPRGRILYYRNPMGLADTSPVPKKDPMGMDYVPVYEGDDEGGSVIRISPDRVQTLGVRTAPAELRRLTHTVRAAGTVEVDERRLKVVAPRFEGYVERLLVDQTGQAVRRSQPLMDVYSPDLVLAQEEYLAARGSLGSLPADASPDARAAARSLVDGVLQRLRNWGIDTAELSRLIGKGGVARTLALTAPAGGVILEKAVVQGQRFQPGDVLYRIADLSDVWLIAEVSEQELPFIHLGQTARAAFQALPGESFTGTVTFIYPVLTAQTRTARVRIELANRDLRLKPALFGAVDIAAGASSDEVLAVPEEALLDSGTKRVVLVQRGEGRFEPREVATGARADGFVEIRQGVAAGETVVTSANFLIDAESNLRAALKGFQKP